MPNNDADAENRGILLERERVLAILASFLPPEEDSDPDFESPFAYMHSDQEIIRYISRFVRSGEAPECR